MTKFNIKSKKKYQNMQQIFFNSPSLYPEINFKTTLLVFKQLIIVNTRKSILCSLPSVCTTSPTSVSILD